MMIVEEVSERLLADVETGMRTGGFACDFGKPKTDLGEPDEAWLRGKVL
jgi:hypothetical protein